MGAHPADSTRAAGAPDGIEATPDLDLFAQRSLLGRRTECQQLLKLLMLAKAGDPKTVLISGDAGMGKSVFLEAVIHVTREGHHGWVLDLRDVRADRAQELYEGVVARLDRLAQCALTQGLQDANGLLAELNLTWDRDEFLRALSLVRLQNDPDRPVTRNVNEQEPLQKAIRSTVPMLKKLRRTTQDTVDRLVARLLDPWLTVAARWVQGAHPALIDLQTHIPTDELLTAPALAQRLVRGLQAVLDVLRGQETALVVVLDDWDRVLHLPPAAQAELKGFLFHWLKEQTYPAQTPLLVAMGTRSEGQSHALGSGLYQLFRSKLLLSPLGVEETERLFTAAFSERGLRVAPEVMTPVFLLTEGTPYAVQKIQQYVLDRLQAHRLPELTLAFYDNLGLAHWTDVLEFSYTRLKLSLMEVTSELESLLATLLSELSDRAFTVAMAQAALCERRGLPAEHVLALLHQLFRHDFLVAIDPPEAFAADESPWYQLRSRVEWAFLAHKTRLVLTAIPQGDQCAYLRRVVPLAIQAGELTRDRTLELLSIVEALAQTAPEEAEDLRVFLEDAFHQALRDAEALVRLNALNSLMVFPLGAEARAAVLHAALLDTDARMREYGLLHLSRWLSTQAEGVDALLSFRGAGWMSRPAATPAEGEPPPVDGGEGEAFFETTGDHPPESPLETLLRDSDEAVRARAFAVMASLPETQLPDNDAGMVRWLDGLLDPLPAIRRVCVRRLGLALGRLPEGAATQTPWFELAQERLLQALSDPAGEVRVAAVGVLAQLPAHPLVLETLITRLGDDPDPAVRSAAVETLLAHPSHADRLEEVLRQSVGDQSPAAEALLKTSIRLLGQEDRRSLEPMLTTLASRLWAVQRLPMVYLSVQALGRVACREDSIALLTTIAAQAADGLIQTAAANAVRQVQRRRDDWATRYHLMRPGLPVTPPSAGPQQLSTLADVSAEEQRLLTP